MELQRMVGKNRLLQLREFSKTQNSLYFLSPFCFCWHILCIICVMCFLAYFVYHICRTQCLQDSIVCTKVRRHTNMSYCVLAQCAAFAPRNAPSCADANCCVLPRELSIGTRADNILHCTGEVPARSAPLLPLMIELMPGNFWKSANAAACWSISQYSCCFMVRGQILIRHPLVLNWMVTRPGAERLESNPVFVFVKCRRDGHARLTTSLADVS